MSQVPGTMEPAEQAARFTGAAPNIILEPTARKRSFVGRRRRGVGGAAHGGRWTNQSKDHTTGKAYIRPVRFGSTLAAAREGTVVMDFDLVFTRDVLLPMSMHAYAEAGLPRPCESLDERVTVVGRIQVDPAKCKEVWDTLQNQARESDSPTDFARARDMLVAVMADSHTFGFVGTTERETFICFRGSHSVLDWLHNAELPLVPNRFRPGAGRAHLGFQAIYETIQQSVLDLAAKAINQRVTILGHSLGGALATLCAIDEKLPAFAERQVFPIASPRVGDSQFRDIFNATLPDSIRIVNRPDLVPHAPLPIEYRHVAKAAVIDSGMTFDFGFAHGLCEGYLRGVNRTIAAPARIHVLD